MHPIHALLAGRRTNTARRTMVATDAQAQRLRFDLRTIAHADSEVDRILRREPVNMVTAMPGTGVALPPVWGHKHEAASGDTIYLGRRNSIRSFVLSNMQSADPLHGRVAITSPIGQALLGRHQGDTVSLPSLEGKTDYLVLKII